MFKSYNTLAEVPEADREHYAPGADGKFYAQVSSDHPLLVANRTLKTEKQTAEEKARTAEADLASAKSSSLPRGHVAVPSAKAALLEQYEPLGTPDEIKAMKGEHQQFKAESEAAKGEKHAASVGEVMGWDKDKTARLVPKVYDLSTVEIRDGKDGKKEAWAKVKQADNTFIEKPFAEVVSATAELSDLLPSLSAQKGGTEYIRQPAGGASPKKESPVDDFIKKRDERNASRPSPFAKTNAQAKTA